MTIDLPRSAGTAEDVSMPQAGLSRPPQATDNPPMASFPASQTTGVGWIVAVLDDLVQFSEFAGLADTRIALAQARLAVTAEIRKKRCDPSD